jgi:putative ABC transport system ATP-binding protein
MNIETVHNLKKYFGKGKNQVKALDGIDLEIEKGKFTAIIGASGSGKTTLLNMIGGMDIPKREQHPGG